MNSKLLLGLALVLGGFITHAKPDSSAGNGATIVAIHQAGEPTTLAELSAWYPAVPEDQNAATVYAGAFALLPESSSDTLPPVEQSQKILNILHQGAARARCRYPVDFNQGLLVKVPHLAKVKLGAKLLEQECILNAGKNRMDLAEQSVMAGLALDRSLETEPLIISQLVRISAIDSTIGGLEQSMWHRTYSEEQLVRLQAALEAAEASNALAFERAPVGERCLGLQVFRLPSEKLGPFIEDVAQMAQPDAPSSHDPAFDKLLEEHAKSPAMTADLEFYLNHSAEAIAISRARFPAALDQAETWTMQVAEAKLEDYSISRCLLPALGKVPEKSAIITAELRVARTVIAVERYRLAHEKGFPNSLNDLAPEYLKAVPTDPFDGAPLRFKMIPQRGYTVYSIGKDRQDDGGIHRPAKPTVHMHYDLAFTVLCDLKPSLAQPKATNSEMDARVLKWQREQADKGDAYGELRMGLRYRDGDGVEQDFAKARKWLQKAAAQGDKDAAAALEKLPKSKDKEVLPPEKLGLNPTNFTIVSAQFGMGKRVADVTARVSELLRSQSEGFTADAKTLGADPLPGKKKHLVIQYAFNGTNCVVTVPATTEVSYRTLEKNARK